MAPPDHLIDEAKFRLDRAADATEVVRRSLMNAGPANDSDQRTRRSALLQLREACAWRNRAAARYFLLSRIFDIGCVQETEAETLRVLIACLFRTPTDVEAVPDVRDSLVLLAKALHGYFHGIPDDGEGATLRQAWDDVEGGLRRLGRDI